MCRNLRSKICSLCKNVGGHMTGSKNSFGTKSTLNTSDGQVNYFSLSKLADSGFTGIDRLPFSIKVLLENLVRNEDGIIIKRSYAIACNCRQKLRYWQFTRLGCQRDISLGNKGGNC